MSTRPTNGATASMGVPGLSATPTFMPCSCIKLPRAGCAALSSSARVLPMHGPGVPADARHVALVRVDGLEVEGVARAASLGDVGDPLARL
eukprot:scaffold43968_cov61-Phaeocystis_antarctica.AAC.2